MTSAWPSARGPVRQPLPLVGLGQISLQLTEIGRAAVVVQQTVATRSAARDVVPGAAAGFAGKRQHQKAFGDHRRDADPRDQPGVLVARTAAPTRAGTSCSSGTASPAATIGRRTPAGRATSLATGPRRAVRPVRTPSGTSRSSTKCGSPQCLRTAAQLGDHQFDGAVGGLGSGASDRARRRCCPMAPATASRRRCRFARPRPAGSRRRPGRRAGPAPSRSRARFRCPARRRPA